MSSAISTLTPQMVHYTEELYDDGGLRWLPYAMYFQPRDHRSSYVNTDELGFRMSTGHDGAQASVGTAPDQEVNLLVGSSMAFGVGATGDEHTVASRLWSVHAPDLPWLSVSGRSHNSTQELITFLLHRHLVPRVRRIVVLSGFNNLGLARQPSVAGWDHGGFFQSGEFWEALSGRRPGWRDLLPRRRGPSLSVADVPRMTASDQVARASEMTLRHLEVWRLLASALSAELSFVLQPLATWVRDQPSPEEQQLFDELDAMFSFSDVFGDILPVPVGRRYADQLAAGCADLDVPFLDLNPILDDESEPERWLFTDRAHLTDAGYDRVARLVAERAGRA